MRLLAQTSVLARAGVAALITSLACYPRIASWTERRGPVWFMLLPLLWSAFVMWGFVFAWHAEYAKRPVFNRDFKPTLWMAGTLFGTSWAVLLHFVMDPQLRLVSPRDYPTDWNSWMAMSLFTLAFDPLFLCFAPFAFFIRLTRTRNISAALTICFMVFVLCMKVTSAQIHPSPMLFVELLVMWIVAGCLSVYFYLRAGALLVWWVVLIGQLRHVADLAGS